MNVAEAECSVCTQILDTNSQLLTSVSSQPLLAIILILGNHVARSAMLLGLTLSDLEG